MSSAKLVFVGDPFQLSIADHGEMPLHDEYWPQNGAPTRSEELDSIFIVHGARATIDAAKALREFILHHGPDDVLSLDDVSVGHVSPAEFAQTLIDEIADRGSAAVGLVATNSEAMRLATVVRNAFGRSGAVAPGEMIELFSYIERNASGVTERERPRRGEIYKVTSVGPPRIYEQSRKGRQKGKVSFSVLELEVEGRHETVPVIAEFLTDEQKGLRPDVSIAVQASSDCRYPYVYTARYAYAVTVYRAQSYPRAFGVIDARYSERFHGDESLPRSAGKRSNSVSL